jgi:DNA-binding MarR family transcriptional regulator
MARAYPGGSLLADVDLLPGMTPGVAQFYRRCIVAGTRRADGAVVCGSQKELALLLQLSQGTVASHVSALQAAGLVVQLRSRTPS